MFIIIIAIGCVNMATLKKNTKQSAVMGLTIHLDGSTIVQPPQIDY